jgi:hypothetical protein
MTFESYSKILPQAVRAGELFSGLLKSCDLGPSEKALYTPAVIRAAIVLAIKWHGSHIKGLQVTQTNIDPFKMYAWFAFALTEVIRSPSDQPLPRRPIAVAVTLMYDLFKKSFPGRTIPRETLNEIIDMAICDKVHPDCAIGRNGLYMIFSVLQKTV